MDRRIALVKQLPRLGEQQTASRRQLHAARRPVEKDDTEFALESTDLLAERRLADVQSRRGPTEMQFLGNDDEGPHGARKKWHARLPV